MKRNNDLSEAQIDVLREVMNVGAGNAATSMSRLIDKKVEMQIPSVNMLPFEQVMDLFGGPDAPVAGMMVTVSGEVGGQVFFILNLDDAQTFLRKMTDQPFLRLQTGRMDELTQSALEEAGNMIICAYVAALSDFTGLSIRPSIPSVTIDMAGAMLSHGLIEVSPHTDFAIIMDTEISTSDVTNGMNGHFLFLPNPGSFNEFIKSVGMTCNG
ncbi:chemotaxis protein CheC [Lentibacillus cibarius]|uniref:CheY-P-specific phosphatase CheC n=1 Tax=Lentibacillus cibarius TaxID=2583219 RepID=A0A5S3QPM1_9BACI|nr:chemotaxis protein CheC [Lentibacillus cibarius]TMN23597.1 CheY-P-specific phosphatase CheC [Lentibacillus cibarius]